MPIVSVEGDEKTWKTNFLLGGPLPQVGFAFDIGLDRSISGHPKVLEGAKLRIEEYDPGMKPEQARELWQAQGDEGLTVFLLPEPMKVGRLLQGFSEQVDFFYQSMQHTLIDPMFAKNKGLVWVDTATLMRRRFNDAYLQDVQKIDPSRQQLIEIEYGRPNGKVRAIYNNFNSQRRNLGLSHHLQDERVEYVDGNGKVQSRKTGKQLLEGLNGTYRFVDVALRFDKKTSPGTQVFDHIEAKWMVCGYNLANEGTVLPLPPTWDNVMKFLMGQVEGVEFALRKKNNEL